MPTTAESNKINSSKQPKEYKSEIELNSVDQLNSLSSTIKVFDCSVKMSEDPFDILKNKGFKAVDTVKNKIEIKKSATTEQKLLSRLFTKKIVKTEIKKKVKEGVFKKIKILANREINLQMKKYYKFPFIISLINDQSTTFIQLQKTFTSALSCAYSNYRKFGESFTVVLFNDIFVFSKELKCTKNSLKLLKRNEIVYTEKEDCIIVDDNDKALVYDIIMNTEIPHNKPLPFILSEFEFDNGMVYRTKLTKEMVVKVGEKLEYFYVLTGPLYSTDFHLEEDYKIEYY